ncbi:phosphatase PAP2 family protein [Mucilaginibacter ginsenosidivorax]|uniref:Phosphatase PAP2 family protein n=1 Tax=Mucilaginibacter ginsenosidivorax TaxID=862126 RepID=A0A5B8VWK5_9SPHI|nr:phosphatase PAP2 family protein [Mucilaginibacter ginsenosidivorax]QEC75292.1 phosphatase PAP2 family protein [Mucilaginibacter ginsenosidivorax]
MLRLEAIPKAIKIVVSAICLFLIFMIPVSRVYLGAHWFTDVLGGFLLGIICLYILSYQYLKTESK